MLAQYTTSQGVESDISCLRSIKESLEDPLQSLSTWNFNNNSEGFVCGFTGVECWNLYENRVISIRLPNMGLTGPFPIGMRNCESIQNLDLSENYLSGSIPSNIVGDLPYLVSLRLSNNNLSGSIPSSIANIKFINTLRLDNNHLTGQIPQEFYKLRRVTEFSVANNRLSGPVPIFSGTNFTEESYANNLDLCGGPLTSCNNDDKLFSDPLFYSGFITGTFIFTFFSTLFTFLWLPRVCKSNYYISIKEIKGLKQHRLTPAIVAAKINSEERKVIAMEKFTRPLSLVELETATNNFDNENIIGYGNMGIMYKAMFPNGLLLAVKRLHKFESFEKEFLLEIEILGRLRHTNIVPLLGFCNEREKRFLVYKYMSNGTLHHWLHSSSPQVEAKNMGWPIRSKIATGIARGLTWLHHNNVLRVIHLKISSRCIVLDYDFEPKISKFSNAKMMVNASETSSSSSTFVVPDCSPYKEDVYSFGILLLELVTGREPSTWINPLADRSREAIMIDESLMGQGFDDEIRETLKIAEKCIQAQTDGEISMLQVYQAICAIGISNNNEISVDLCMNIEDN